MGGALRGYLLTREERFLDQVKAAQADFGATTTGLGAIANTDEAKRLVDQIERAEVEYVAAVGRMISIRKTDTAIDTVSRAFDSELLPKREAIDQAVSAFASLEQRFLDEGKKSATSTASSATIVVGVMALAALLLAIGISLLLTRTLSRQIGSAVQHVQSSSSELQTAANQQATGAKEQSTAMNEITTTISELLATSKQIAESAWPTSLRKRSRGRAPENRRFRRPAIRLVASNDRST
jgi:methyl-accepting chemotaxis protein